MEDRERRRNGEKEKEGEKERHVPPLLAQSDQWCNLELGGPWAKMQGQPSKVPFPIPLSSYLSSSL